MKSTDPLELSLLTIRQAPVLFTPPHHSLRASAGRCVVQARWQRASMRGHNADMAGTMRTWRAQCGHGGQHVSPRLPHQQLPQRV